MSTDIQDTVISVKQSKMFTMQVDESTDISGKAQLMAFIRSFSDGKISDQFFCFKELQKVRLVKIFSIPLASIWKKVN